MVNKIIIAGFGGQGIILAGSLLAYTAMIEGNEVSHIPSYGAEMRGGTCNCSVVISDRLIDSPIIAKPDITLVFNQPSKDKFESRCKENGIIILNSSLIDEKVKRNDLNAYYINATNLACKIGNIKAANMVMLGALIKITNIVDIDKMIKSLKEVISKRNIALLEINEKALMSGYENI